MTRDANKVIHRSGSEAAQLDNTLIKIDIDAQHQRAIRWSDCLGLVSVISAIGQTNWFKTHLRLNTTVLLSKCLRCSPLTRNEN